MSNIAWNPSEDKLVADLLNRYGIDMIDVAPGKYFSAPEKATKAEITDVKKWWFNRGIGIVGMQSLLFGTKGLNVFGSNESRLQTLQHLKAICAIAAGLGARYLVFGSPKNRDRLGFNDQEALDIAVDFFRRLGDVAKNYGVFICLEPNPTCYGANFMTTSEETAKVVTAVSHEAIMMQLDVGALTINGEIASDILFATSNLVGHIHISEPGLVPLGDGVVDHPEIHKALVKFLPSHVAAIEMLATESESHMSSIERAIKVAVHNYTS